MPIPIAPQVELPDRVVTGTAAIIGARGSGKSYLASVVAEGMIRGNLPLVVIDPTGVWWGLRVAADGKTGGLPIAIIGGQRGDLPLQPGSGAPLARMVANGLSCIIDISQLEKKHWQRVLLDFFVTLYSTNTHPLHLFLDEADVIAPQRAGRGSVQELHDIVDDIARRGRVKGLGCTFITQRPAVLSKNVLSQVDLLAILRLTAPQDHKAVEAWINAHDEHNRRNEVLGSLATLRPGEAWVWAPMMDIFCRLKVQRRTTFDSSSTPEVGKQQRIVRSFAAVDTDQLRELMAVNEAETASPPSSTRHGVTGSHQLPPQPDATRLRLEEENRWLREENAALRRVLAEHPTAEELARAVAESNLHEHIKRSLQPKRRFAAVAEMLGSKKHQQASAEQKKLPAAPATPPANPATPPADQEPRGGAIDRILLAIQWWESIGFVAPNRTQVAFVAGYSPNSGTYANYLGRLRTTHLIEYSEGSRVCLTPAGRARTPRNKAMATEADLHDRVRKQLTPALQRVLDVLLVNRGRPITREQLADATGYAKGSGTFANYIGRLHTLELLHYPRPGEVAAAAFLFLDRSA